MLMSTSCSRLSTKQELSGAAKDPVEMTWLQSEQQLASMTNSSRGSTVTGNSCYVNIHQQQGSCWKPAYHQQFQLFRLPAVQKSLATARQEEHQLSRNTERQGQPELAHQLGRSQIHNMRREAVLTENSCFDNVSCDSHHVAAASGLSTVGTSDLDATDMGWQARHQLEAVGRH